MTCHYNRSKSSPKHHHHHRRRHRHHHQQQNMFLHFWASNRQEMTEGCFASLKNCILLQLWHARNDERVVASSKNCTLDSFGSIFNFSFFDARTFLFDYCLNMIFCFFLILLIFFDAWISFDTLNIQQWQTLRCSSKDPFNSPSRTIGVSCQITCFKHVQASFSNSSGSLVY